VSSTLEGRLQQLEALNAGLAEQVKRLVRTEARLYAFQEELDRQRRVYSAVAAAGQRLAETHDLERILAIAVGSVTSGIQLERSAVFMASPGNAEMLEAAASDGYDEPPAVRVPRDHPVFASLPLRCDLTTRNPALVAFGKDLLVDEYAVLPLSRPGDEFAALVAGNQRKHVNLYARISPETMVVLSLFAGQVTTNIENARRYQELRMRNAEVERANQAKSAFLATMSHELRTPLNAIIGFTRLVIRKSTGLLPERQVDNLRKVETSAFALLAIINDLLDLSKVEAGRMTTSIQEVDLNAIAEQVATELGGLATARNLLLDLELDSALPIVSTDAQRVRQMLINLTSNAIKFTRRGGIRIRTSPRPPSGVVMSVIDTGIGIPANQMARIFEPFHQVDGGITREVGGTGLGLTIVREMATLLGGTVRAESELGVGSTFTLELPLQAPRARDEGSEAPDVRRPDQREGADADTDVSPAGVGGGVR
jgi:signal transduction histidine kinase